MRTDHKNGLALKGPPVALVAIVAALMWCAARMTEGLDFPFAGNLAVAVDYWLVGASICIAGVVSLRLDKTTVNTMKIATRPGDESTVPSADDATISLKAADEHRRSIAQLFESS